MIVSLSKLTEECNTWPFGNVKTGQALALGLGDELLQQSDASIKVEEVGGYYYA